MATGNDVTVEVAFAAAIRGSKVAAVGKWTPVEYWLTKMDHDSGDYPLTPGELLRKVEGDLNRELSLPDDKTKYGSKIQRIILSSHKKIQVNQKKKKIHFLFLETKQLQPPSWSTLDEWQNYYDSFVQRRQTHRLRVERRSSIEQRRRLSVSTIVDEEAPSAPRPVTPTAIELDDDIKALLEPFFKELNNSSFKGDNGGLRKAIKAFGCRQQWIDNERDAEAKEGDQSSLEALHLKAINSHSSFLDRYCCPPRKSCLQGFIALATMIDKEQPAVDIFQLTKRGGKGRSCRSGNKLVPIIPTTSTEPRSYPDNAKQWLPRVLDASVAGAANSNRYHASFLLLKALNKLEPKAFDDLVRILPKRSFGKMDVHRQMSMAKEANITYTQLRVMRPFLIADRCNPLHSEHEVRKQEIKSSHEPVFIDFKEDQYKRQGWVLPVDKIVEDFITSSAGTGALQQPPPEIHVILSADHGQGHWKANIACVLIDSNNRVVKETNTVIASVECRKDKRQVLIDCGVPAKINQFLDTLKQRRNNAVVVAGGDAEGAMVKLFATGDLAWYAEALGKPNMAGDHCALCRWRCQKARKANPKEHFPAWVTMEQLKTHFNRLEDGTLDRADKSEECGVVALPLIDAIEPPNYITPLLHCVTLFINTPFKYLHRWIWYRVEGILPALIHARDELALASLEKDRLWEQKLEAEEHLQMMYSELEDLAPGADHVLFDDKDHEAEYQQQRAVIQVAEEAVEEAELAHETAAIAERKASAKVNRMEGLKSHGRAHQDVWMAVENRLKALKVYSSAYHGGDMEGNQCRELVKQAPTIMGAVKETVLEYLAEAEGDTSRLADEAEVALFTSGFCRLFQYFDVVSHYCYQPFGSLTDSDLAKLELSVNRLVDLYLKILPNCPMKLHMIATHLVPHVKQFRGLKSHHESHIERAHQQGMKDRRRLGVLGCFAKKTISALKTEATANKAEVVAMAADTQARRRKRKAVAMLEDEAAKNRKTYLQSILEMQPIVAEFPSLLELAKESMRGADKD
jgi:hypothetical protein